MSRGWYRLDNAALIFPSVETRRLTHLFRLSATLDRVVDVEVLTRALAAVAPRFPAFQVRMVPGVFWYTLVDEASVPRPIPETTSPCQIVKRRFRSPHLYRVRWYRQRIAVEFHHSLTDGMGGLVFLKALVAEYLAQVQGLDDDPERVRRLGVFADPAEAEDAFRVLHEPAYPRFEAWNRAYRPAQARLPRGDYAVTSLALPLDRVLAAARAQGASLTEYLAATLLEAFQEGFLRLGPADRRRRARPLRLVLPVNLRPVFGAQTLRNFFVVVPVEIDLRLGTYTFPEILRLVHHQLQAEMDPRLLRKQVVRNLRGELNPVARALPLPVKSLVLSTVFGAYERQHTASLSNLGRAGWPAPWEASVTGVDFVPPPSPHCPVNVGVVSQGNRLSVTFGSLNAEPTVEADFARLVRSRGLPVVVESNRPVLEE